MPLAKMLQVSEEIPVALSLAKNTTKLVAGALNLISRCITVVCFWWQVQNFLHSAILRMFVFRSRCNEKVTFRRCHIFAACIFHRYSIVKRTGNGAWAVFLCVSTSVF